MPISYQVEGTRQNLKVCFYLESFYFSQLPHRLRNGGGIKIYPVLFTQGTVSLVRELKVSMWGRDESHFIDERKCWQIDAFIYLLSHFIFYFLL